MVKKKGLAAKGKGLTRQEKSILPLCGHEISEPGSKTSGGRDVGTYEDEDSDGDDDAILEIAIQ